MNKGTRTFIYGFFLLGLGFLVASYGMEQENNYYKTFEVIVGFLNMIYGFKTIEKTTL